MRRPLRVAAWLVLALLLVLGGAALLPGARARLASLVGGDRAEAAPRETIDVAGPPPPAVTVAEAATRSFSDQAYVSGTLVAREDVMVSTQIDGLRIVDVMAEDGDRVREGQVLARLDPQQLDAQLAQSDAGLIRADAAIAQARSQIQQVEATSTQASADYQRGRQLGLGVISQSTLDLRLSAARSGEAQLAAARSALAVAEADRKSLEAQRRELQVKIDRTEVRAPAAGIVSRRAARVGMLVAGSGDPLFRLTRAGEIDLDAEVPDDALARIRTGMAARVTIQGGAAPVAGSVRLIASEVDRATRLGRVRVALPGVEPGRIGSFANAVIEIDRHDGVAVPATAVMRGERGRAVEVVANGRVEMRKVETGLASRDLVEITEGVTPGETVVVRAAAFLRSGDAVRPIRPAVQESQR